MMRNVRFAFNQAANHYDKHSRVQQHTGNQLIQLIRLNRSEVKSMIDLGCGTGLTSLQLCKEMPYQYVEAIDVAEETLIHAREKLSHYSVQIYKADFDTHLFDHQLFDLIFSNMALHWSTDVEKLLLKLSGQLTSKGLLSFSIPLINTFNELPSHSRNDFYSIDYILHLIKKSKLEIVSAHEEYISLSFDSMYEACKYIKSTGANHVFKKPKRALNKTELFQTKYFSLTYHIGYFIAEKTP